MGRKGGKKSQEVRIDKSHSCGIHNRLTPQVINFTHEGI